MSSAVEKIDFSQYDRVIVSSSWFAHGLITWEHTKTIIYYHAPARYMWDWTNEYKKDIWMDTGIKWFLFWRLLLKLRLWDYEAAQNNDVLLSNSTTTQSRVQKYFRRGSHVLYPPIETKRFAKKLNSKNITSFFESKKYYIILSALTEFKKLDIAITAFSKMPEVNLLIIWAGEYRKNLEELSGESKNIVFAWAQYDDDLVSLVQNSLWLVFPGEEDFGIVPIEIMAAGKPVFALHKWWLTETVLAWETWDFFQNSDWSDFIDNFNTFHENNLEGIYSSENCKKQAAIFDETVFHKKIQEFMK
jgi:glycosyltransferase involved in cell wall biosynthesis